MTELQIQGKWFWVQNNRKFKITEFELAGSNGKVQMLDNQIYYN